MGHRRFVPKDHSYRRNRKDFNDTIEKCLAPKYRDGPAILRELNKLEVVLGKGDNAVAATILIPCKLEVVLGKGDKLEVVLMGAFGRKNRFSGNYLTGHF